VAWLIAVALGPVIGVVHAAWRGPAKADGVARAVLPRDEHCTAHVVWLAPKGAMRLVPKGAMWLGPPVAGLRPRGKRPALPLPAERANEGAACVS
jgi:hypothetical protein